MDRITIKGLKLTACHGYLESEQTRPQDFIIDCCLHLDLFEAGASDDFADTICYSDVGDLIERIFTRAERANLIEHICEKICNSILSEFKEVKQVDVTIKKPNATMNQKDFDYVAVDMTRFAQ